MTREEAIAAAPSSRREYWVSFMGCSVLPIGAIIAGLLSRHRAAASAWVPFAIFVTPLGLIALQSAERLFYPVRSAQRSETLSAATRTWLIKIKSLYFATFCVLYGLRILTFIVNSHSSLSSALGIFMWLPLVFIGLLRNLLGERAYWRTLSRSAPLSIANIKPLQSDHWGENSQISE